MAKSTIPLREIERTSSIMHWMEGEAALMFPNENDWRERLIFNLYDFFEENPRAIRLQAFCDAYRIHIKSFRSWARTYDDIGKHVENIKSMLAQRRFVAALNVDSGVRPDVALLHIDQYDEEFREGKVFDANLRKQQDKEERDVTIRVLPVKDTGLAKCPTE